MQRYTLSIAIIAGILLTVPARADTIEMLDTGLKLEGKVQRELEDAIIFLVDKEQSQIRILKSKIKNIEYDINTQLDKLAEDDYAGRYKVGVWAIEKTMYPEAIKLLEDLKGQEGPGADLPKLLGFAYEQRKQLDKALENYSDYAKLHPDDKQVAEKVAALAKEVNPEPVANGEVKVAVAKPKVVDGLEGDGVWVAENWGNPGKAQFYNDPATGNKMIVVQSDGGDKDKTAISRTGQPLDLTDSKEMIARISHNAAAPVGIAIAYINSQGEFHETQAIRVPPNTWVPISQKMDGKVFKANRNNFKDYNLELDGRERINRIAFLVYGQKPFNMYIDAVFFKQKPEPPKPDAKADGK
jgi:tetratricopeptide (TPR) repeat protein